ncbi:MAG: 16S rRNA (cytidine(1402)-2'-O)-methyltransferase [Proteobacteria bacterium]|nr:16S rRNA (cytidine(1402)-2'-O)-methyltransferase [Pseudomonadota bacterium]
MNDSIKNTGTLYIVATPIGNLDDISERALATLAQVDIIACEDTRHSGRMLASYGIKNKLMSFHAHNENQSAQKIVQLLQQDNDIALISDAGTPLISDPGYPLVKQAHENNIKVVPIVGASAIIALLSCCGLPTNEFHFTGFLAAKSTQRKQQLATINNYSGTSIVYESTHRILRSLADMQEVFGSNRLIAIGRELTKTFETVKLGTISEIKSFIESDANQQKGEFVIAIAEKENTVVDTITIQQKELVQLLSKELPPKKAAKITAQYLNGKSKDIYNYLIKPVSS